MITSDLGNRLPGADGFSSIAGSDPQTSERPPNTNMMLPLVRSIALTVYPILGINLASTNETFGI
jgi:hypothetical protein